MAPYNRCRDVMESLVVDDADLRHRPLTSLRPARPETGVFLVGVVTFLHLLTASLALAVE